MQRIFNEYLSWNCSLTRRENKSDKDRLLILSQKIFLEAELIEEGSAWEIPGDESSGSAHICSHINIIMKTLSQTLMWRILL